MLTGRWLLQLEKFSMPMSCNFPTECRRWASTSSFWLVSFCVFFSLWPPLPWHFLTELLG